MKKSLQQILILFLFLSPLLNAQSNVNLFSFQNRKKFADYLFCNKDYLRAFEEYRPFLKHFNNDTVKFKIAIGFRAMQRYREALLYFKELFFNSNFTNQSRNEFFKTLFLSNQIKAIKQYINEPIFNTNDSLNIPLKLFYAGRIFRLENIPDSNTLRKIFPADEYSRMKYFSLKGKTLPLKSAATAGILSALIPGLGKIYTGYYGDGITAFLMTSAFAILSYTNFKANHNFRAWLFAGLTGLFYSGNIYGSVVSANLINARIKFDFKRTFEMFLKSVNYFIPHYDFLCN